MMAREVAVKVVLLGREENWPDWYAAYMVAEQSSKGTAVVKDYDAIVIGPGQAGPYMTSRLAGAGMKVRLVAQALARWLRHRDRQRHAHRLPCRGMPFDAIADFGPITLATTQGSTQLQRTLELEMESGAIDADRSRQILSTGNRVDR